DSDILAFYQPEILGYTDSKIISVSKASNWDDNQFALELYQVVLRTWILQSNGPLLSLVNVGSVIRQQKKSTLGCTLI
ncbi:hypothetical protein BB558_007678, partial [Smittium angustum]